MTGLVGEPVPCPQACVCGECGLPIERGKPALPDGFGPQHEQLWAHPACWRMRFGGI